jgi:hypothetical protein
LLFQLYFIPHIFPRQNLHFFLHGSSWKRNSLVASAIYLTVMLARPPTHLIAGLEEGDVIPFVEQLYSDCLKRHGENHQQTRIVLEYMEQTLVARAELGDNHSVSWLLTLRNHSITIASSLAAVISARPDQLNLANLRGLSLLRDNVIPGGGFVC